jgi:hypothetical protein
LGTFKQLTSPKGTRTYSDCPPGHPPVLPVSQVDIILIARLYLTCVRNRRNLGSDPLHSSSVPRLTGISLTVHARHQARVVGVVAHGRQLLLTELASSTSDLERNNDLVARNQVLDLWSDSVNDTPTYQLCSSNIEGGMTYMNSCPRISPLWRPSISEWYKWRSLPQMVVPEIFTITSFGSLISGMGASTIRTSLLPNQARARMVSPPSRCLYSGLVVAVESVLATKTDMNVCNGEGFSWMGTGLAHSPLDPCGLEQRSRWSAF